MCALCQLISLFDTLPIATTSQMLGYWDGTIVRSRSMLDLVDMTLCKLAYRESHTRISCSQTSCSILLMHVRIIAHAHAPTHAVHVHAPTDISHSHTCVATSVGFSWGKRYRSPYIGDPLVLGWRDTIHLPIIVWGNVQLNDIAYRGKVNAT